MGILDKCKPKHGRLHRRAGGTLAALVAALVAVVSMAFAPAAMADMDGYDISNWQCGIDTATVPADFVIVGTTWGSGGVYGGCMSNGVNTDANRQLAGAINSGKETGVYHYAFGGDPETEARFFVDNVRGYVHKSVLILDWEEQDNAAWGDKQWPRRWAREVKRLTGVNPIIYTMDSGYWQVAGMETELDCGIWIAQYATNLVTGYQTAPWNIGARGEVMRQYTSNGSLSGWSGRLDLNKFRGDRAAWRKYANPEDKGAAGLPDVKPTPQPTTSPTVDLDALATRTIRGDFGNDPARRQALGSNYAAVMDIVNRRLGGSTGASTAVDCGDVCVTVGVGDTLSSIAASNGGSWNQWTGYRSGNPALIYPGETVCRRTGPAATPAYAGGGRYVVRAGDTLGGIAAYYGVNMYSIHGYRSGNPALIYPGETLYW
ncbi:GH25 family lysozyme [Bifidobacterium longum]|uniref:GH25 family lysozyme n=1 Tax=Bifidobacterium longum TaxID=216816 RepID=UPI0020247E73|nr:GH25 family lysozyme [Bifidobacterium longum]